MARIMVSSSWKNERQPLVVDELRSAGFEVYDFRKPESAFSWDQVDPNYKSWNASQFRDALNHPLAKTAFGHDSGGMKAAHYGVLVLPCGKSAHLEAGWMAGRGIPTFALFVDGMEPELMYNLLWGNCLSIKELIEKMKALK